MVSRSFCMRAFYWLNKRQEDRRKREKEGREGGRKGKRKKDFSGGPVVKTPCLHGRGCGFDPWSENQDLTGCAAQPQRKRKRERERRKEGKKERKERDLAFKYFER